MDEMLYVTVKNKSGDKSSYFARTEESAIQMAVSLGRVRQAINATAVDTKSVCPTCFPHEGNALFHMQPQSGWAAIEIPLVWQKFPDGSKGCVRHMQLSSVLHSQCDCTNHDKVKE